jgi:hypothetical protein
MAATVFCFGGAGADTMRMYGGAGALAIGGAGNDPDQRRASARGVAKTRDDRRFQQSETESKQSISLRLEARSRLAAERCTATCRSKSREADCGSRRQRQQLCLPLGLVLGRPAAGRLRRYK